jgi:hypothetical protein
MDGMLDRTYIVAAEGGEARFTWLEHRSGITREHERKREGGGAGGEGKGRQKEGARRVVPLAPWRTRATS